MIFFGAFVKTVVNVATLPVDAAKDTVMVIADAANGDDIGKRTAAKLQQIKDDCDE